MTYSKQNRLSPSPNSEPTQESLDNIRESLLNIKESLKHIRESLNNVGIIVDINHPVPPKPAKSSWSQELSVDKLLNDVKMTFSL